MPISFIPSSIPVSFDNVLDYFAENYGFHGTIMAIRDGSRALMEVKQLQFSCIYHRWPTQQWDNPNSPKPWDYNKCDPEEVRQHAIPEAEYSKYQQALFYHPDNMWLFEAYDNSANYNLPFNRKRWVEVDDTEYIKLSKLKVLDYD